MQNNTLLQILTSAAFLVLAVVFLNPFNIWMPTMTHMVVLGFLVAVFGVFALLMMRERAQDEREEAHRSSAGRAAFLTSALILLIGIVWQAMRGPVDHWLIGALCGMVIAKIAVGLYIERTR
jgi:hypothetical protein